MTGQVLFANNPVTTLTNPVSTGDVSISVTNGSAFPSPGANQYFTVTLVAASNSGAFEIVWCTARSGNTLTVTRAQEGTTAQAWSVGDGVANFITAGSMNSFVQTYQAQASAYSYGVDTGTANAYVVALSPVVSSAPAAGFPIRVKIANANTGASTLDAGWGAQPIIYADNLLSLIGGDLVAGAIYTLVWDGTHWQMQTPTQIQTITTATGICRLYPDGWKEQQGIQNPSNSNFSFPVAFNSATNVVLTCSIAVPGGSGNDVGFGYVVNASTGFVATRAQGGGTGSYAVSWRATGY